MSAWPAPSRTMFLQFKTRTVFDQQQSLFRDLVGTPPDRLASRSGFDDQILFAGDLDGRLGDIRHEDDVIVGAGLFDRLLDRLEDVRPAVGIDAERRPGRRAGIFRRGHRDGGPYADGQEQDDPGRNYADHDPEAAARASGAADRSPLLILLVRVTPDFLPGLASDRGAVSSWAAGSSVSETSLSQDAASSSSGGAATAGAGAGTAGREGAGVGRSGTGDRTGRAGALTAGVACAPPSWAEPATARRAPRSRPARGRSCEG